MRNEWPKWFETIVLALTKNFSLNGINSIRVNLQKFFQTAKTTVSKINSNTSCAVCRQTIVPFYRTFQSIEFHANYYTTYLLCRPAKIVCVCDLTEEYELHVQPIHHAHGMSSNSWTGLQTEGKV